MYNQYFKLLQEAENARDKASDYIKDTQEGLAYTLADNRFTTHLRLQKYLKKLSEEEIRDLANHLGIAHQQHSLPNLIRILGRADRTGSV